MSDMPHSEPHRANAVHGTDDMSPQGVVRQQSSATSDLVQLFTFDLAHCPRFDHTAEHTLARHARSTWLQLLLSVKAQHEHLATLLSAQHLPSSYDAISETEILQLLHQVHIHVNQTKKRVSAQDSERLQSWLAQVRANLACFRDCRDEMVRRNLRFVLMLARRYQHPGVSLLDLVQEGVLGMMRAVEKFDPDRGVRFSSYAVWWIREAFARALISRDETTRFPDTPLGDEDEESPVDRIAAPNDASPEMMVLQADTAHKLHQALTCLPTQEADVIRLRFGLSEGRALTLEQIGQRLDLSRAQVQLREQRALARLRAYMQRLDTSTGHSTQDPRRRWRTAA